MAMENNEDDPIKMLLKIDMRCKCSANKILQRVQGVEGVLNVEFEANKTERGQREPSVKTEVLNVENICQCKGCLEKIRKCVTKFKGVENMFFDKVNKLINVKGTMDVKALSETLANRIRKRVEILPPQKAKGKMKATEEEKEEEEEEDCGKMEAPAPAPAYESSYGQVFHSGYGPSSDGKGYEPFNYSFTYGKIPYEHTYEYWYRSSMPRLDAPQIFSEENPNACSIM